MQQRIVRDVSDNGYSVNGGMDEVRLRRGRTRADIRHLGEMLLSGVAPLRGAFPQCGSPPQIALRLSGVIGIRPLRGLRCKPK